MDVLTIKLTSDILVMKVHPELLKNLINSCYANLFSVLVRSPYNFRINVSRLSNVNF